MTAVMRYTLVCNGGSADAPCEEYFDAADEKAGIARASAAKQGWTFRMVPRTPTSQMRSQDLCPKHAGLATVSAAGWCNKGHPLFEDGGCLCGPP